MDNSNDKYRIVVDVEARGKKFELSLEKDIKVEDVLNEIISTCTEEGVEVDTWAKKQVGNDYQFVLMRKSEGNAILPPSLSFENISPKVEDGEIFKLSTQAVVGGNLPTKLFNQRIENLIDDFYISGLKEIYKKEKWLLCMPRKIGDTWRHAQYQVSINSKYQDGAYKDLLFTLNNFPGVIEMDQQNIHLSLSHKFLITIPREYPRDLGKIVIVTKSDIFHPRFGRKESLACYHVNGELDRVLIDILFSILMRPENVRPPSMYTSADNGINAQAMKHYEIHNPVLVYRTLYSQWAKYQQILK